MRNIYPVLSWVEKALTARVKLGNLLGCLLAAMYGDRLGRKNTLRAGGVISAIGGILQFTAYSFPQLLVGRVVNGIGNGMSYSLILPIQRFPADQICRYAVFHLRYLPSRILRQQSKRKTFSHCSPSQCCLLLHCNVVDAWMLFPPRRLAVASSTCCSGNKHCLPLPKSRRY
jgi:hypothetical protein